MTAQLKLSNVQLELLKMYANDVAEEDLLAIKQLMIDYFANKIIHNAAKIWTKKGYSDDFFLKQHF